MAKNISRHSKKNRSSTVAANPSETPSRFTPLVCVLGFFLGVHLLFQFFTYAYALFHPYAVNYVEGFSVDEALRVWQTGGLYSDPSQAPYTVSVYPPLYPLLVGLVLQAAGASLLPGRLVSLIAFVVIALLIYGSVVERRGRVQGAVAAALLLLSSAFHPWAALNKPDLLALALSFGGLFLVTKRDHARNTIIAAGLFAAALWTKQNSLAAPLAATLLCFVQSRRRGFQLLVPMTVFGVVPFVAVHMWTDGWFTYHLVEANLNPWSVQGVLFFFSEFAKNHLILLLLIPLAVWQHAGDLRRSLGNLPLLYLAAATLAAISVGKLGADANYLMEPLIALIWFLGTSWDTSRVVNRFGTALLLAGALIVQSVMFLPGNLHHYRLASRSRDSMEKATRLVREIDGPVISDDAALLVTNDRRIRYRPFIMCQLSEAGIWDQTPLLRELEREHYAALVLQTEPGWILRTRYTREMVEVMSRHYAPVDSFKSMGYTFTLFLPVGDASRSPDSSPSATR